MDAEMKVPAVGGSGLWAVESSFCFYEELVDNNSSYFHFDSASLNQLLPLLPRNQKINLARPVTGQAVPRDYSAQTLQLKF